MRFKDAQAEAEFAKRLHPAVRQVLEELDDWCLENALPQVVVTCLGRSGLENQAANGVTHSWHLYSCAADIRSKHYTPTQKAVVLSWLTRTCPKPMWELLEHDAGSGSHFHLARRDFSWRNTFSKRPADA